MSESKTMTHSSPTPDSPRPPTWRPAGRIASALKASLLGLVALSVGCVDPGLGVDEAPWGFEPAPPAPPGATAAWQTARFPARAAAGQVEIHFTRPGLARGEEEDPEADDAVVLGLQSAVESVDLCVYEFSRANIVEAAVQAAERGVDLRFVGDGDEHHDAGYLRLEEAGAEMALRRPRDRIMHNKFAVVDARWLFTGSMNFSENGVQFNNNNLLRIDSPALAAVYRAEFSQMYAERHFGRHKEPVDLERVLTIGGREVEVYFSPEDEIGDRQREVLQDAQHAVLFMIFSFTDKDVAGDLIDLHERGVQVVGVYDESQARSRYSTVRTLARAGVPVFIDGNGNARGFAGGKLHHKAMLIDPGTGSDPTVLTGSFNWSEGANRYNDENLLVLHGADFMRPFLEQFCEVLEAATPHPDLRQPPPDPCANLLTPVRINEVLANPVGRDGDQEFVELVNTGSASVDLSGWTLGDKSRAARHVFDNERLAPGAALVVHSGPDPDEGGRLVASSGALGLANNADEVVLRDADGVLIDQVRYQSAMSGVSFNRSPDGSPDGPLVPHYELSDDDASPWRRADGSSWQSGARTGVPVLNEVMANPEGTDRGNEFVEVVNAGGTPVDLTGWRIGDAGDGRRHVFGELLLQPGEAVVVFDSGAHGGVANAVLASSGALSLNNSNERVTLYNAQGRFSDVLAYASAPDGRSLNRAVDGDGDAAWIPHDEVPGAQGSASPGRRADGGLFSAEGDIVAIRINELLPNPEGRDAGAEFVELVNAGTVAVPLAGWALGDAVDGARHVFPETSLLPGQAVVVFDAGDHPHVAGAQSASSGALSLNNSGDLVRLFDADGELHDAVVYDGCRSGVSLNRSPDGAADGPLVQHDGLPGVAGASSPGRRADGSAW